MIHYNWIREGDRMSDNELLRAISEMMDTKLKSVLQEELKKEIRPMKADIADLKQEIQPMKVSIGNREREVAGIKIHLENVTDRNIRLLAENYVPAARRYEKEVSQIESMKTDIEILKQVVTEHSEKLQKLAY